MEPYRYSAVDHSILQPFLNKYLWFPIVEALPKSLTPNTITVIGGINGFLSGFFMWLALDKGYRWGFLAAGATLFIYLTGDNIDGPHARKTGQASKLGEFLDHWFDSLHFLIITLSCIFSFQIVHWGAIVLPISGAMAFFLTLWEHHHKGVFVGGMLGTNEGIFIIIALYILLFFFHGEPLWIYREDAVTFATVLALFTSIGYIYTGLGCLWRVRGFLWETIPPFLMMVMFGLSYMMGCLDRFWAPVLIMLINSLAIGRLLVDRLAHKTSPLRLPIITVISVAGIISVILYPNPHQIYTYLAWIGTASFLIILVWDMIRMLIFSKSEVK